MPARENRLLTILGIYDVKCDFSVLSNCLLIVSPFSKQMTTGDKYACILAPFWQNSLRDSEIRS